MSDPETPTPSRRLSPGLLMLVITAQMEGALAVVAVLIAWFAGIPLREMFRFEPLVFLWGSLATMPMIVLCWLLYRFSGKEIEFIKRFMTTIYRDFIRHCSPVQLFLISLLAGICEELMFRGVIQTGIAQWIGGTNGLVTGILVASLLFGLMHPISRLYVILCIAIGIYFGVLFAWSSNLVIPMLAHALYDFCILLYFPRLVTPSQPGR